MSEGFTQRPRHQVADLTEEAFLVPLLRQLAADASEEEVLVPRLRHVAAEGRS